MKYTFVFFIIFFYQILFFSVGCLENLSAHTKIVDGEMIYRFEVLSQNQELLDTFYEYSIESNIQKVIERRKGVIVVETKAYLGPFESSVPFPAFPDKNRYYQMAEYLDLSTIVEGYIVRTGPGGSRRTDFVERTPMNQTEIDFLTEQAFKITAEAQYQHQAVEKVMRFLRQEVTYQLNTSTNPVDVIKSGRGHCEGYANAGALLLRVLGIPARIVSSYIPPGFMWGLGQGGSGGFHAHIEVFYDDIGWAAYDPQATVHYVDPYHIVNFPRSGVRIRELKNQDDTVIVDIKPKPEGYDNFYKRRASNKQYSPLLTGTIIDTQGKQVKDSFRNNVWVYTRNSDGSGQGIRILANGMFAVAPQKAEDSVIIFYHDKNGSWFEWQVEFSGNERLEKHWDLSDPEQRITIDIDRRQSSLYLWYYPNESSRAENSAEWRLDEIRSNRNGDIQLVSKGRQWIVSKTANALSPRYLLEPDSIKKNSSIRLEELPRYLDPLLYHVRGRINYEVEKEREMFTVRAARINGNSYPPREAGSEDGFIFPLQDPDFKQIIFEAAGLIGIYIVNFYEAPVWNIIVNLQDDTMHTSAEVVVQEELSGAPEMLTAEKAVEDEIIRVYIETGEPNTPFYFTRRQGNRFYNVAQTSTDTSGEVLLVLDSDFFSGEERFYLSVGAPVSRNMVELTPELYHTNITVSP